MRIWETILATSVKERHLDASTVTVNEVEYDMTVACEALYAMASMGDSTGGDRTSDHKHYLGELFDYYLEDEWDDIEGCEDEEEKEELQAEYDELMDAMTDLTEILAMEVHSVELEIFTSSFWMEFVAYE